MAGSDCHHIISIVSCNAHGGKRQSLPCRRACPKQAKHRDSQPLYSDRRGNSLSQQVSAKEISDVRRLQMLLPHSQQASLLLHGALCRFPGILPKEIFALHHIEHLAQRSFPLLFSYHGCAVDQKWRLLELNALLSFYHIKIPRLSSISSSQAPVASW